MWNKQRVVEHTTEETSKNAVAKNKHYFITVNEWVFYNNWIERFLSLWQMTLFRLDTHTEKELETMNVKHVHEPITKQSERSLLWFVVACSMCSYLVFRWLWKEPAKDTQIYRVNAEHEHFNIK